MGEWQETNQSWYRLQLNYCALCGQVIPRRLWVVELGGARAVFCGEPCEALYRDYVLGEGAPPAPSGAAETSATSVKG